MEFLRTSRSDQTNIDSENKIIRNIIAIESGDLKDYRKYSINENFLSDLVSFANSQKDGILVNYGHNYNNLGKRLGRATNFREENGKVLYDLKIFNSADLAPGSENMGTYVMELAAEDDKALMSSIVYNPEYYYQLDTSGAEIKVHYYNEDAGQWIQDNPDLGKVYPKFAELYSVDVVDEGAATNSFFNKSDFSYLFFKMQGEEGFEEFLAENYQKLTKLNAFFQNKYSSSAYQKVKSLLGFGGFEDQIESLENQLKEQIEKYDSLEAYHEKTLKEHEACIDKQNDEFAILSAQNKALEEQIESLQKEVVRLGNLATTKPTGGDEGNFDGEDPESASGTYQLNEFQRRVNEAYERRKHVYKTTRKIF